MGRVRLSDKYYMDLPNYYFEYREIFMMKLYRFSIFYLVVAGYFTIAASAYDVSSSDTVWPGKDWATSTPEAEGIDPDAINSLVADIEAGVYGLVDQFVLIRHGRIVADHKFPHDYRAIAAKLDPDRKPLGSAGDDQYNYDHPNWHPYYQETKLHTLQSVTKSVTSAALGVAVTEGLIKDAQVPVMPYFSSYDHDLSDPRKSDITLEDFLTMRSGIDWVTTGGYDSNEHSTIQLEASEQWIQFILNRPMETKSGERFDYNDGVSVLLGKIIREATGQRADKWAKEKLFTPIGIDEFHWKITPDGEADTEGGLYLATHDLARIGYLFLRGGEWNGKRILSEAWVKSSVTPFVSDVAPDNDQNNTGYGYQWWIPSHENGEAKIYSGNGYGGQFIMVVPEYDIVLAINSWSLHVDKFKWPNSILQDIIIPALKDDK